MFKLPAPLLGKLMRFFSPKKETPKVLDKKKHWHLQGNWSPVKKEVTADNLDVIGEIPTELNGLYIRNGMNPQSGYSDHWFFGNGMVHGINLENGKATYKNRYVKTPYYEDDMDMMGSSFDMKASPANTHVIRHAGKILALEEAHHPWIIDDNLETIKNRISIYDKETSPLIDFYNNKKLLYEINGNKPIKSVYQEIENYLKNK